jgi:hypothetical protein
MNDPSHNESDTRDHKRFNKSNHVINLTLNKHIKRPLNNEKEWEWCKFSLLTREKSCLSGPPQEAEEVFEAIFSIFFPNSLDLGVIYLS